MSKSIIISERDNIAAVMENNKVSEFYINRGDMLLGDVYLAYIENILPSIDAAFVNLGGDRMGFLHASDIPGKGPLKDRLKPKQQLLVQIIKEPTGHKGPRVTTSLSLPGRFLVLMPDEKGISVSRKIVSPKERARLKSVVNLLKPAGVGVIIRTEAEAQSESEIQEDLELLLERWNNIVSAADTVTPPNLLYRDQDILYRVIREACTEEIGEIIIDTPFAVHRTNQLLQSWNIGHGIKVSAYKGNDSLLSVKGIDKEIRAALQTKVTLPSGGYLYVQTTEALTVIDVNSGKFTSSSTQNETIRKTNLESVNEIARQLRLRNIGGMIIIDFIDMENRVDQLAILQELEVALEPDKAKPQVGQLSDLGLVELTRHRQGQSLAEVFTKKCPACSGNGIVIEELSFATPPVEAESRNNNKNQKLRLPQNLNKRLNNNNANNNNYNNNVQQKHPVDIKQVVNNQDKTEQQRKVIKTFPAISTSSVQRISSSKKPAIEPTVEFSEETLKQLFGSKGFLPNISKIVRFSALPPKTARKYMSENYIIDVFTILQELENFEIQAANQVAQISNQTVKLPKIVKVEEPIIEEPIPQSEVAVLEKIETSNEEIVEFEQKTLIEVEIPTESMVKTEDKNNNNQENSNILESTSTEEALEDKKEFEIKKPVRRGRKPKSETSKSSQGRRRTTKTTKPNLKKE